MMKKRPTWNQYFMNIAYIVASRSPDPDTQVGCVIVDKDRRIVSTGYNGTPPGYPHLEEDWTRPNKYKMVTHAEINALLFSRTDLNNCSLYTTLQPCCDCIKAIAASGIKNIYYAEERPDKDLLKFVKNCGILLRKITISIKCV
jgi:dCMP deaminase